MQQITNDGDASTGERSVAITDVAREHREIEERLCGVRVPAVARIDDAPAKVTRSEPWSTSALMAQNDHVAAQRLKGADGIDQRLPFPTDEVATLKVVTRAPRAVAAASNEIRVRVEGS